MTTQYNEMFTKFQNGQITEEVWFDFCRDCLVQVLEDNKDVLVRLKFR